MMEGDETPVITVPKFASFRPKAQVPAEKESRSRNKGRSRDRSRDDDKERDHNRKQDRSREHRRRDRDRSSERRRDRDRDRDRDMRAYRERDDRGHRRRKEWETRSQSRGRGDEKHWDSSQKPRGIQPATSPPNPRIIPTDLFYIDTRGDPLVLRYGIDRYAIPDFKREPRRYLLGSSDKLVIHRDGPREEFSLLKPGEFLGSPPLRDKRLTYGVTRLLKGGDGGEELGEVILVGKKRKRGVFEESNDDGLDFRSIEGKAKARYYSESESDDDFEMDGVDSTVKALPVPEGTSSILSAEQKAQILNRKVTENPSDTDSWIQLINLQTQLHSSGVPTVAELKTTSEIKMSMIRRASKHCTDKKHMEDLMVWNIALLRHLYTPDKGRKKLVEIRNRKFGNSYLVWAAAVEYEMTEAQDFEVDAVKKLHVDRIRHLSVLARSVDGAAKEECWREIIQIFLRLTRYLQETGFRELAVAAWQTFLEANFRRPNAFVSTMTDDELLEAFTDFWESEVYRIGELGAKGWSAFYDARGIELAPDGIERKPKEFVYDASRDICEAWVEREANVAAECKMPARTLDDEPRDDLFRIVMAGDLEGMLLFVPRDIFPMVCEQIIDSLLIFCHLPVCFGSSQWIANAQTEMVLQPVLPTIDHVIAGPTVRNWFEDLSVAPGMVPEYAWQLIRSLAPSAPMVPLSPVCLKWLLTTLTQLAQCVEIAKYPNLSGYIMTLGALIHRENLQAHAQAQLRTANQNTELYHLYAALETCNENPVRAREILTSSSRIPSMTSSKPSVTDITIGFIWLEMSQEGPVEALKKMFILLNPEAKVAAGEEKQEEIAGTKVLQMETMLRRMFEKARDLGDWRGASGVGKVAVLLGYLSGQHGNQPQNGKQGNIAVAMDLFLSHLMSLCPDTVMTDPVRLRYKEDFLAFGTSLLLHYAARGPHQRSFLHSHIVDFLKQSPHNLFLIDALAHINSTTLLRPHFHAALALTGTATTATDTPPSTYLAVLSYELRHGTLISALATVEKAIAVDGLGGYSPLFWRVYLRLEAGQNSARRQVAEVFWRAVGRCVWSKEVAMEGLAILGGLEKKRKKGKRKETEKVEDDEKLAIESLGMKGMRLHIDFDLFVEQNV